MKMRRIKKLKDVVDWGLCTGCGACVYFCEKEAVTLLNIEDVGILAKVDNDRCGSCDKCLEFCPGFGVNSGKFPRNFAQEELFDPLLGPYGKIWEGHAADESLRYHASSGGALSALALYCIEKEGMGFVLHTAMSPDNPWRNITVRSFDKTDIFKSAGSRYGPSSPCAQLDLIEESNAPCVFIGRPCDTAAVLSLRAIRPKLDSKLGLVLTFFCAGPPCTQGTMNIVKNLGVNPCDVSDIRYRGNGWPGKFRVTYNSGKHKDLSYKESWGGLAHSHRSMRCHLCPDGLGECADISCGDAWHRQVGDGNPGLSLILARTSRGLMLVEKAQRAGYLKLSSSSATSVIKAQGLISRRKMLHGRLLARKLFMIPNPVFKEFKLVSAWHQLLFLQRVKTVLGTCKRILFRKLWRVQLPFD